MDREAWQAAVHGVTGVGHCLTTKSLPCTYLNISVWYLDQFCGYSCHINVFFVLNFTGINLFSIYRKKVIGIKNLYKMVVIKGWSLI